MKLSLTLSSIWSRHKEFLLILGLFASQFGMFWAILKNSPVLAVPFIAMMVFCAKLMPDKTIPHK